MPTAPRPRFHAALHAFLVVVAYGVFFTWLFSKPIVTAGYLSESDLYEYYLPIFLAPITTWSSYEFSGLPAFADPGDFSLYPPHFLFARVLHSWTGFIVSAFVMAGVFTYAYVYRVTRSRTAAAFAGFAYAMSEAMVERVPHLGTLHCFAWLPLILLAIEELRGERRRTWIAIGGCAVACAFLSGHPQPAIYTVYLSGLYAVVGARAERAPLGVYLSLAAMFLCGGLLGSIKAIPLVEASVVMARQEVNFGQFISHANSPAQMLSILFPTILHEGREAPTYVGLLTLGFAFVGASLLRTNWRAAFWVCVTAFALLVGAGDATPIARLLYAVVPLYQKFRVGARHLFLAAFGFAFLAGYGIAAVQRGEVRQRRVCAAVLALITLIAAGAALQALRPAMFDYEVRRFPAMTSPIWNPGVWTQLACATMSAAVLLVAATRRRLAFVVSLAGVVLCLDLLNSLPHPVTATGLDYGMIPIAAARPSVHALKLETKLQPMRQRALALGGTQNDSVLPAAFARLWKIPIAGGYGPMLIDRYSQLGTMGTNGSVRPSVLANRDSALDIMAVRYLLVTEDDVPRVETFDADGFTWARPEFGLPVGRPDCNLRYTRTTSIPIPAGIDVKAIGLVTHMRCSEHVPQGTDVALLRVSNAAGAVEEHRMRAGIETAEEGVLQPDVAPRAQHQAPANVFRDPTDPPGLRSFSRVTLTAPIRGGRLEIDTPPTGGWLTIDRLTFMDAEGHSHPVSAPGVWLEDPARWRAVDRFATSRVTDRGADEVRPGETNYTVFENLRAEPRAWIAAEVRAVNDPDAIETIHRGQFADGTSFNPRETAIVSPDEGPSGGPFSPGSSRANVQQISDGRVRVAVSTRGGGFLVLSESHYRGWRARIDGNLTPVRRADVAFQGVVVPSGDHVVEFEFVSMTLRAGAALSVIGLLVCAALIASDLRKRRHPAPPNVA